MARLEKIVSNFVFFLLFLLAFLLIFESHVTIPYWLQPVGRMHPMVLHFPIALIVMLVLLDLFQSHLEPASFEKVHKVLLYATAVTTSLSAIMGFFLSKEEGYTSDLMALHKWIGVSVSYLVYLLLLTDQKKWWYKITLYSSLVILFFAGHFGAGLTHGMDFLLEPITKNQKKEITENTPVFEAFVDPILEAKCKGCHNHQKRKGDLDMTSYALMTRGGEHGPVWIQGNPAGSEIIKRALLPLEHEHHMPPEGKPQLTGSELALLKSWISAGADANVSMAQLDPSDTLLMLAKQRMKARQGGGNRPRYDFDFASKDLVASLNNPYRTIVQQTPGSPALDVNIFVKQAFKSEYISELKKIKDQVVSLNLAYMPVKDDDLTTIAALDNLEKLNLNHTDITSAALAYLDKCTRLNSLSLSGTAVDMQLSDGLGQLPALKDVYLWNTSITHDNLTELKKQWPAIRFHLGYQANEEDLIRLTPPLLKNKNKVLERGERIVLEHKLPGVSIRYTIDGSDPDSISSLIYQKPIDIQSFTDIKTIAYKDGWLTSEVQVFEFFVKGASPVEAGLINPPSRKCQGKGAMSLMDFEEGEATNFRGKPWLGYKDKPFAAWVDFGEKPPALQQMVLSFGINMSQYIMPPVQVEIWGGNDLNDVRLLKRLTPPPPDAYRPDAVSGMRVPFATSSFRYYKIKALPVKKLPPWHAGKGSPGWVFVDELFFY